ncbi:MFS family permease [Elusimicrobium simillimum]|uniref:MDR family MFS transporter n=1 Tax=Elusimicrobium simillimum TaxID=3143438 RepID=UPI003C6FC79B
MKLTKEVFTVSLANALIVMGYGLSVPFFAIYLNVQRGIPASIVGAIVAFAMLGTSVASGVSGELSDVLGRKKVMVVSLYLRAASMLLMGLAMALGAHYIWIIICHVLGSFFGAFFRPASNAWIADTVSRKNLMQAFGYIRIGLNIGWASGPAIGGILAGHSFALPFALTGVAYALTGIFLHFNIKECFVRSKERKAKFTDMVLELKNPRLFKMCILIFAIALVSAQLVTGLSLHGINYIKLTQGQIGMLFSINGLVVVLLQYHMGKIMTGIRVTTALIIGCIIYGIGYILVGAAHAFTLAAVGVSLVSIGEMALSPGSNTLISNIAPDKLRGRYLGMQEVSRQIGVACGMFAAGMMIEHLSPIHQIIPWLLVGAVAFAAAFGFYKIRCMFTPEEDGLNQPLTPPPPAKNDDVQVVS